MLEAIDNGRPSIWHLNKFTEFVRFKEMAGEPSPHLRTVVHLSKHLDWSEKVWRIGCYAAPYSVLSAEILWTFWPYKKSANVLGLEDWLGEHWGNLHIRTERRGVRSLANFVKCLVGYREWINSELRPMLANEPKTRQGTGEFYERLWKVVNRVPFFGRYIAIRAIEGFDRLGIANAKLHDIRAIGGHSPIRALTLFYPECTTALLNEDESVVASCGERLVKQVRPKVPTLTHYVCAAMLCEYRKAFEDGHEYAARTQDAEVGHYDKHLAYWAELGFKSKIPEARSQIFDHRCLGEKQGWSGVRSELERTLKDYAYNWTDTKYDYKSTTDFANPVRWGA